MQNSPETSAKRIAKTVEYKFFARCISPIFKICRESARRKIVRKYSADLRHAFEMLREKVKLEFALFLTPGDKMEFVRFLHQHAPAYDKFYSLDI